MTSKVNYLGGLRTSATHIASGTTIVTDAPIDAKYLTIWYERTAPLLVEAIKELADEIDEIKKKML